MKIKIIMALVVSSTVFSGVALAENANTNVITSASVENTCRISMDDISFGEIDWLKGDNYLRTMSTVKVFCNKNTVYEIYPEQPNGLPYNFMTGTGTNKDVIQYVFARDADYKRWNFVNKIAGVGNASEQSYMVHGEILKTSNPSIRYQSATNTRNSLARPDTYSGTSAVYIAY